MRNRKNEDTDVPVSSLIDVVFLLIFFFVITSNIEKEAFDVPINLVKAQNMKPATTAPPKRVTLNIQKGKGKADGLVYVENMPVAVEMLKSVLINVKKISGSGCVVMIRADKEVLYQHDADVIEAIKASGLSKIRIQAELEEKK
jgi:biopolymer transport protein ExbD